MSAKPWPTISYKEWTDYLKGDTMTVPSQPIPERPTHPPGSITDEQLQNWFTYHKPEGDQQDRFLTIRNAGLLLAAVIRDNCPPCADTSAAIRKVREAVMTANQSIACGGQ